MSDRNPPITARQNDVEVTLVAAIGGFRSDMSITRMIDGNFWKRFRQCFVFQSRVSTKTVVKELHGSANDPRTANDPGPQMIPKLDRKRYRTGNDPRWGPQMIPTKKIRNGMDVRMVRTGNGVNSNRPFYQYGGHFEFYCFK